MGGGGDFIVHKMPLKAVFPPFLYLEYSPFTKSAEMQHFDLQPRMKHVANSDNYLRRDNKK
jgi:hypothetical protein